LIDCGQSTFAANEAIRPPFINAKYSWRKGGIIFLKNNSQLPSRNFALISNGRTNSPSEIRKIMKLLTNRTIDPVIENNGAFQWRMSPRSSALHPAAPFVRIPGGGGFAVAQRERPKDWSGIIILGLAILFVIAAGTEWGWAIMNLDGLLLQAGAVLLRNTLPLS
jgi:hypothetical protein